MQIRDETASLLADAQRWHLRRAFVWPARLIASHKCPCARYHYHVYCSGIAVDRIRALVSKPEWVEFTELDMLDAPALNAALAAKRYGAVIHFAALKVGHVLLP